MIGEGSTILNRFVLVLAASLALGLTGCGGGGGSAGPSSQSISGGGVKGPLANAVVTVYSFDASQSGFKGSVVDDATTDANAGITGLALPFPIAPPYIMEFTSTPGTTTDITTDQFPVITTMRTVITQSLLDGGEQIYATPLTTMAVDIAIANSNSSTTAAEFVAALTPAASQVVSTLGFGLDSSVDIFDTPPLIDSTTDTTAEQADVAAYRAAVEAVTAIAYEIDQQTAGGDTDSVLAELAADLADGDIDGSAGTEIDTNTLQILQQDPATLTIPNTTQTVADVQAILVDETTTTGTSTDITELDVGGSIVTTAAPAETNPDLDNDTYLNADDAFPTDASEHLDTDGDGTGNNADSDDDNDGWADGVDSDDYPLDATLYIDPALDRDTDGADNGVDNCPLVSNPDQADADNDGLGDACDPATDADGDGIDDTTLDNCPAVANTSQTDTDSNGEGDACDADIDGDGEANATDAFPYDPTETTDTDGDGLGNTIADDDDDNDGVADTSDTGVAPAGAPSEGVACSLLIDCDGDGYMDNIDQDPLDPAVTVNFAPVALDGTATTDEDTLLPVAVIDVLATDSNAGDTLTVTAVSTPSNGTAVANGNNIDYTPSPNFNGTDLFTYTVSDGNGGSDTGAVTVTIAAVNDAPTTTVDAETTNEDAPVTTVDVTANDNDVDGDTLTAVLLANATDGNVVDNGNNTFTYTPNTNFNGSDSFTYTVSDGNGGSATGTVNVTVNAVNDNPVAVADSLTTDEDTAGMTVDVTANDTDIDAGTILSVVAGNPTATHGTVVNNNDGTFTYTPDADFNGSDSFTYTLSDGTTGTATGTVNVTVTPVNDAPVAVVDPVTTDEDSSVSTGNVKSNDSDVDGDSLTATLLANASNGNVVANGSGSSGAGFTYTPNADFNGTDSFTYTLSDGNGGTAVGTVNITVNPINDAPAAVVDNETTDEDTLVTTADVTLNDDDAEGDTLTAVLLANASNGNVVDNGNNTFTYTPNADFNGSDSFTYTVSDGNSGTDTGTVNVTVTPVNDAPSALADAFPAGVATLAVLDVLANDTDIDGDTLTITAVSVGSRGSTITTDGSTVSFTDTVGVGTETFTYDISDGNGGTATGISVTVTVTANIPPVANADSATTNEDTAVTTGNVLVNDTDGGDGPGALSITDADTASANGGVVTNHGDGTFTYSPAADYFGADTFTYTVSDTASSSVGTVTITVNAVNDAPVALDDSVDTTAEDTLVTTVNVLTNDTDTENDLLSVLAADISSSNGGVVVNNSNGTFDYTPALNFNGVDSFTYTVSDGVLTSIATVYINVTPVNDAPVAVNDIETAIVDVALITGNVLSNDTDVDSGTLTITASDTASANGGTVSDNGNDTFTYTSAAGYVGADSFTYTVSDGLLTAVGTVNIMVTPAGTPIAMTTLLGTTEGGLGALGSWPGEAGVNEYEYWTDSYDAGTQTFAWADFVFNYSTNTFEADGSDTDVALNGSGTWVNEGVVRVVEADDGNGNMTIGIRDEADTVDVEQVKLSARYVDIAGQAISGYLDAQWQSAMIDDATVFGANAKLISSYTFEMVTNGYLMHSGNWCQIDDPSRYATLNTTSVNNNCNGIDVPVGTDASGFATSLGQLEVATPFVDNNDFSTPDVAVSFGWEGSLNLRVEFAPGNVANYYVVDWSGDATTTTSLVATGAYTRDTTVQGVDMIRFVPPAAAYAQFPEVMAESSGYLVAMEGGFARLGDYILAGSVNSEIDTVLNGHALDDVLANFDAIEALSFNHIDFTGGITAYDLYYDAGVPTWCIDSLGLDGAGGVAQSDYVVCSGMPGSYSGSYSVDATTGVLTITDDVPETFYGKVVGYNDTYGAREVCWSLSNTGPWTCTEGDDFFSYMFADPTAATSAMNSLNGVSLCDYETADGSFDSYTDFEAIIADCGNEVAVTAVELEGTWVSSWTEADTSTTTLTYIYNADGSGTYSEDNSVAGNWDSGEFNWYISAGRVIADGTGITPGYTDIIVVLADGRQKVYAEDTGWGADLVADSNADGVIFTDYLVKQTSSLACGYESGWDDLADGGLGAPIVPNSFDEFETLLADCYTPWEFAAADVAGKSFLDDLETMTFTLGGAAGTEADRGTGIAVDVDTFNFEWYVEDATCAGCTYQYLVIYADYAMNPTLVPPGFWFRETEALININGTPGVAGAEYQFMNYAEQSNYSDTIRESGSDAEIWGPSGSILQ